MENMSVAKCVTVLICIFYVKGVLCLRPPSYVSPWVIMNIYDPLTLTQTFNHYFTVYPVKADVQVMSTFSGLIYPGVNTAQADNIYGVRAGVVCKYDALSVILYAPNGMHLPAYMIYPGGQTQTTNIETATEAFVRVRLWHPYDFPLPTLSHSFYITTTPTHGNMWNISHGGSQVPEFVTVRGKARDRWIFEAVGSNMQITWATHALWGAVVYGINNRNVSIWAPVNGEGSLFSICGGWGETESTDCSYDEADLQITVWQSLETSAVAHCQIDIDGQDDYCESPVPFDVNTDLLSVQARVNQHRFTGMLFSGTGAVVSDDTGLVYAYSNTGDIRIWYPALNEGSMIRIGPNMGRTNNIIEIRQATAVIKVWKVQDHLEYPAIGEEQASEFPQELSSTIAKDHLSTTTRNDPTFTSQEPLSTTTLQEPLSTTTLQEPLSTTTLQEPLSTTTLQEPLSTTTLQEPLSTTTLQEPLSTTTLQEPLSTTTLQEPLSTTTLQEPLSTTTLQEPLSTTTLQEPLSTTTLQEPLSTTTLQEPLSTTTLQEPLSTTTLQEPLSTTTLQEPLSTTTLEEPLSTTTLQEFVSTIMSQEALSTTTLQEALSTTTLQESLSTTTLQEPLSTTSQNSLQTTTLNEPSVTQTVTPHSTTEQSNNTFTVCFEQFNRSNTDAKIIGDSIAKNLSVPVKETAKYMRKLTSAVDKRTSSRVIGWVGGGVCGTLAFVIVAPDVFHLYKFLTLN